MVVDDEFPGRFRIGQLFLQPFRLILDGRIGV